MDFIIKLFLSIKSFNIILTVVDRLSKERYYISYTAENEETSTEETTNLFLR
jgi:hypothetical protein